MTNNLKQESAYKTIGEIAKELNLVDENTGRLQTHTIRYWETQFKQISPIIKAGGRRYYTNKNIKMINLIKFLLKDKGLTIKGVQKMLKEKGSDSIDDLMNFSVYKPVDNSTKFIKEKVKNISKIIKEIKKIKDG